jgi:hypothetical protein
MTPGAPNVGASAPTPRGLRSGGEPPAIFTATFARGGTASAVTRSVSGLQADSFTAWAATRGAAHQAHLSVSARDVRGMAVPLVRCEGWSGAGQGPTGRPIAGGFPDRVPLAFAGEFLTPLVGLLVVVRKILDHCIAIADQESVRRSGKVGEAQDTRSGTVAGCLGKGRHSDGVDG